MVKYDYRPARLINELLSYSRVYASNPLLDFSTLPWPSTKRHSVFAASQSKHEHFWSVRHRLSQPSSAPPSLSYTRRAEVPAVAQ